MFILFFIFIIVIEEEATGVHSCHQPLYTAGCLLCSITPTSVSLLHAIHFFPTLVRTRNSLSWRTPSTFWRPKILRPKKSFMGLSVVQTSHLKVRNGPLVFNTCSWEPRKPPFQQFKFPLLLFFLCIKEVLLNRENSSESIASMASTASHASMASLKDQEAKKKKKKSWVSSLSAHVYRSEETGM